MDAGRYIERIGLDPDSLGSVGPETLASLQRAHVTTVPFETLSITGDPYGDRDPEGPSLDVLEMYAKIVDRNRGGWCFELNGLFGWLLARLGFDVERIAGRVVSDDGQARPPANHHPLLVSVDRTYVVDVGIGTPTMRRPVPLDGGARTDEIDVRWRIVESERPDADYKAQCRSTGADDWSDRYVFRTTPRDLAFFSATSDFLATAPESPFTGEPTVTIGTDRGHLHLHPDGLSRTVGGQEREEAIEEAEWYDALESEFGLGYP